MSNNHAFNGQNIVGSSSNSSDNENTGFNNEEHLLSQRQSILFSESNGGLDQPDQQFIEEAGITLIPEMDKPSNEEISQERRQQKSFNALCQICKRNEWIYTCPRCHTRTCCLDCVRKHKKETSCSGIRDKVAYIPLQKYNESNMMSDYTYLEDVSRQADNVTRSRLSVTKDIKHKAAENKARLVTKIANSMGIRFSSLPVGMSRNKLNQTNYSKNLRQIFWSLEINFCKNNRRERYLEHSFPSNKPLYAFFENLLYAESPQGKSDYHIIRHQVNDFVQAGLDQFKVALKKEKAPRGYFIDVSNVMDALFRDVLKDEVIIEFPIFYIWLKSDEQPSDISVLEEKKQPLIVPLREAAGNKDHFDMDNNSQLQTGMAQQQNIEKEDQGQTQADGNPKNTDIDPIQPSNDAEVIIDENVINEESNDAIVTEEIETKASTEVTCSTNIPNENQ